MMTDFLFILVTNLLFTSNSVMALHNGGVVMSLYIYLFMREMIESRTITKGE